MQTMEVGHVPVAGATPAISTFVWLLALSYLYIEMTTDERAMGVFILPLLVALAGDPGAPPGVEDRAAVLQGPLFGVHVSSLLFAYASFALACVIGITYVLLFKEIKAKHLGFFYARLPSLQVLDRMNQRAIVIGWIFLTIGIIVGVVWAAQARVGTAGDPRVQAMSLEDPKIFVALRVLGRVLVRAVRRAADRLGRTSHGVPVGARFRHRAPEFRADHLFFLEVAQFLI